MILTCFVIIIGFNCSLFAYGQTGAGKSYSMVGYGNNKLVYYPDRVKSFIILPKYPTLSKSSHYLTHQPWKLWQKNLFEAS